jgi:hypothetical protein
VAIDRKNQERLTRVNAEVETALSEAVKSVRARLPQLGVPKDFSVGFGAAVTDLGQLSQRLVQPFLDRPDLFVGRPDPLPDIGHLAM